MGIIRTFPLFHISATLLHMTEFATEVGGINMWRIKRFKEKKIKSFYEIKLKEIEELIYI